jgi:hypothetical protein
MDDAEGELIDIILQVRSFLGRHLMLCQFKKKPVQVGISEGCGVCGRLKSKLEQEVCGVLCEIVGLFFLGRQKEF